MAMNNKILLFFLVGSCISASSKNNDYSDFCSQMNEKMTIDFFVPQKMMDFHTYLEIPFIAITFGDLLEGFPTNPVFEVGPTLNLSKNCSILIMDLDLVRKKNTEIESNNKEYSMPVSTGWMLNNCSTPWAQWYIEGVSGLRINGNQKQSGFRELSEEERVDLKERVSNLRLLYERCIENNKLTNKINCDKVYVVKIPNLDKISNMMDPGYVNILNKEATECYGVEFYKQSLGNSFKMLFFINGNKTTIDKCITKLSKYISFQ